MDPKVGRGLYIVLPIDCCVLIVLIPLLLLLLAGRARERVSLLVNSDLRGRRNHFSITRAADSSRS